MRIFLVMSRMYKEVRNRIKYKKNILKVRKNIPYFGNSPHNMLAKNAFNQKLRLKDVL